MNKLLLVGLGVVFIAHKLSGKSESEAVRNSGQSSRYVPSANRIVAPTRTGNRRGCDPLGCGHYGASRGSRSHKGVDYAANLGEEILSPITGIIERYPDPYGDGQYSGVQIKGSGLHEAYRVKMFYLSPTVAVGQQVVAGQKVGNAQNISARHGARMINHVHLELYKNGQSIDIANLIA